MQGLVIGGQMISLLLKALMISMYGFDQLISDPTHMLPASPSCTDLIFTDQPNLLVDSGVQPSLHANCHHKIMYIL